MFGESEEWAPSDERRKSKSNHDMGHIPKADPHPGQLKAFIRQCESVMAESRPRTRSQPVTHRRSYSPPTPPFQGESISLTSVEPPIPLRPMTLGPPFPPPRLDANPANEVPELGRRCLGQASTGGGVGVDVASSRRGAGLARRVDSPWSLSLQATTGFI